MSIEEKKYCLFTLGIFLLDFNHYYFFETFV